MQRLAAVCFVQIMSSIAELHALKEFVHFGCTSEDVNNLAYALCIGDAM